MKVHVFLRTVLIVMLLLLWCNKAVADNRVETTGTVVPGAMPCVGNPRIVVVCVTFPGGSSDSANNIWRSTEAVNSWFFSPELKESTDAALAYSDQDSLRSFYYRSSYGKLDIDGEVFEYTAQNDARYYLEDELIWDEIIDYYTDKIDWKSYDSNQDGYLDGLYLLSRTNPGWVMNGSNSNNYVTEHSREIGGVKVNKVAFIRTEQLSTVAHETFHMFGLHDIYSGAGLNPDGINTHSIMGSGPDRDGDIPGICKYLMGWIDSPHFITGQGEQSITLSSYSTKGELVIIYPNGDPENENWFVVEYVTKEANNQHGNGVRIWRTCMDGIDGEHNIVEHNPYSYLEALSPEGITHYYYQAGDQLTPTTVPTTAYGAEYLTLGYTRHISKMAYSGISIEVVGMNGSEVELLISIDNEMPSINNTARVDVLDPRQDFTFVDRTEGFTFATITAECEMNIVGELALIHTLTAEKIPVTPFIRSGNKQVWLMVETADLHRIQLDEEYFLQLPGKVVAYTGSELLYEGFNGTLSFPDIKVSLYNDGRVFPYASTISSPHYFLKDETHICYIARDPNTYAATLNIFDTETKKEQVVALEEYTPLKELSVYVASNDPQNSNLIKLGDEYFVIFFRHNVKFQNGDWYTPYYFVCYTFDGVLVDSMSYLVAGNMVCHTDSWGHYVYWNDRYIDALYELKLDNGRLTLAKTEMSYWDLKAYSAVSEDGKYSFSSVAGVEKISEGVYAVCYRQGYAGTPTDIKPDAFRVMTLANNVRISDVEAGWDNAGVTVDGRMYLFKLTQDMKLLLDVYASNGQLVRQQTLCNSLPLDGEFFPNLMDVEYVDGMFLLALEGYSSLYPRSCKATTLLAFDAELNLKYYYHSSNEWYRGGIPYYIGNDSFIFLGEQLVHQAHLNKCTDDAQHIQTKKYGKPATQNENGLTDGVVCGLCGKVIVEQRIIPHLGCSSVLGDADCNGIVDVYDALLVLQHDAGWDVMLCTLNADYDADGAISINDAVQILQYCKGGDLVSAMRALADMMNSLSISAPAIEKQPADQYVAVGERAKFAVSATGDGLTYQWYINRNDSRGWQKLKDATTPTYATSVVEMNNDGFRYRCVIADVYGREVASDAAVLHVAMELPNTGDESTPLIWIAVCVLSALGLMSLMNRRVIV